MTEVSNLPGVVSHGKRAGAASQSSAARDAQLNSKLVTSAHEFEASLMQELLKPLSSGQMFGEDDQTAGGSWTSSDEGSGGALMSFGSEALAKALSEKGGMGIARRVLDHFEKAPGESKSSDGASKARSRSG